MDDGTRAAMGSDLEELAEAPRAAGRAAPPVCERCHVLANYGVVQPVSVDEAGLLRAIGTGPGVVVHVVDVFDLPGSVLAVAKRACQPVTQLLLVVNKIDLLDIDCKRQASKQASKPKIAWFGGPQLASSSTQI
jgi:hypothetical protein